MKVIAALFSAQPTRLIFSILFAAALLAGAGWRLQSVENHDDESMDQLVPNAAALAGSCGVERWSVKTGTDADAGLVNLGATTSNTIATMAGWPAPATIPLNNRVAPYETTVWALTATLTQYKLESDSDYHMVLSDGAGHTLIAEIPDPACVSAASPFASRISSARTKFNAKYTATGSFQTANIPVLVTGTGMFDFLHGQTGVAPNGIELHTVLDITFNPSAADFSLAASPISVAVAQGGSANVTATTAVSGGFSSSVALSASGLPAGASYSFTPASIAAPGAGSSTLRLTAGATTTPGTYSVLISGTGGGKTHTASVSFNVNNSAIYSISGTITVGGSALSGATVALSGASSGAATTSTAGTYSLTNLAAGSYTVTPSKSGYTFTPASASVTLGPNATANFTATAVTGGAIALSNGVGVSASVNSSSADSSYKDFTLAVPAGASNLTIATSASTGDVDLYVKFGATPSLTVYDCRPYTSSGNESCSFSAPSTGTYYVRVYGYATGSISFTTTGSYSTGGGTATERMVNGGFESGAANWTAASAFSVATSGSYPHTGTANAYNSATNSTTGSLYQTVAVPATATAATLTFWLNIVTQESTSATSAYDTLTVQVKDTSGATLGTLATYSNVNNKDNGNTAGSYVKKSFSLLAYKGKTVRIYFGSSTDVSYPTTFRVDDVSLMADGQ